MSTLDEREPKPHDRTRRARALAITDVPSSLQTLWIFYGLIFVATIGLIVYAIVRGPDRASDALKIAPSIFVFIAVAIGQIIFAIEHFDARISRLEAALNDRDGRNKPDNDP